MADFLEDLRDNYKNSRQSNDTKLKLNGATYRKMRSTTRTGNTLTKTGSEDAYHECLDELNNIYDLNAKNDMNRDNLSFSLNKKKRWQLAGQLKESMLEYATDDMDVRLFEMRNRNEKKANCIAIHRTKGEPVRVKKTYANLESIKRKEQLDIIAKLKKEEEQRAAEADTDMSGKTENRKNRAGHKKKNKSHSRIEHIWMTDVPKNDTLGTEGTIKGDYLQYEIEYAPKKDILKHRANKINSNGMFQNSNKNHFRMNFSDDDVYYHDESEYDYDTSTSDNEPISSENYKHANRSDFGDQSSFDDDNEYSFDDGDDDYDDDNEQEQIRVPLSDLVNIYAKQLIQKEEAKKKKTESNISSLSSLPQFDTKNRKFFSNKSDCFKYHIKKAESMTSISNPSVSSAKKKGQSHKVKQIKRTIESAQFDIRLTKESCEPSRLTDTYGARYSEAANCWPRLFNINLSKSIQDKLINEHGNYAYQLNVLVWIRFEQQINRDSENNSDLYRVSFLTNLLDEAIAIKRLHEYERMSNTANFDLSKDVVVKSIDYIANFPVTKFRMNDNQRVSSNLSSDVVEDLPHLGSSTQTINIAELKLNAVNNCLHGQLVKPKLERLNSKQVVQVEASEPSLTAAEVDARLTKIFSDKYFDCVICFERIDSLADGIIAKSCAHGMCKACLKGYVDYILMNPLMNAGQFNCPSCDHELGLPLIISFASNATTSANNSGANQFDCLLRHYVERVVLVLSEYQWCPSPGCSNVLSLDLNSNPYGTVRCSCGYQMCLKCNAAPHFPAKCGPMIANYYNELKKISDFKDDIEKKNNHEIYVSVGRRCPKCKTFMEKNGGCNHMICSICKTEFCWGCGQFYNEHIYDCGFYLSKNPHMRSNVTVQYKNETKTKALKLPKTSQRFDKAFEHRRKRKPAENSRLREAARRLVAGVKITDRHFNEETQSTTTTSKRDDMKAIVDKANQMLEWRKASSAFMIDLISLLGEMHFICEHGYLLLTDGSLDKDMRLKLSGLVKSLEIIMYSVEFKLDYGKPCVETVESLRRLYQKGLNCISVLRGLHVD